MQYVIHDFGCVSMRENRSQILFFSAMTTENEILNHFADPSSTNVFIW